MKNQRLRHILTTTVACATLTSLVSPQAFAERVVEDAANDSAIVTTDNDQGSTVSEEATADDVTDGKNDPKGLAETVKEIEDVSDKAITAGEKAVSLKDAEDRKDPANAADAKSTGEALTWGYAPRSTTIAAVQLRCSMGRSGTEQRIALRFN